MEDVCPFQKHQYLKYYLNCLFLCMFKAFTDKSHILKENGLFVSLHNTLYIETMLLGYSFCVIFIVITLAAESLKIKLYLLILN